MRASGVLKALMEKLRGLSWRAWIIGGYLFLAAALVVSAITFVFAPFNEEVEQRQIDNMTASAQADAAALETVSDPQAFVKAATDGTDLRITVFDKTGTPIADSEVDPATMENHLNREEVRGALAGDVISTQRMSETDRESRLYVAVPARYDGEKAALRVSETSAAVHMATDNLQMAFFLFAFIGCVVILIVALISLKKSNVPFQRLDRLRTDFVANASHELKTPVAGIRLLSEAIRDAAELDDKRNLALFVERLEGEAERLQRLVIDLLDLSRLEEAPEQGRRQTSIDLHSVLTTSYLSHKAQAEDKGLEFVLIDHSSAEDACLAAMEPSDASLIFDNLIENAIMYTDAGSITVAFEPGAHELSVSVKDTGIGIAEADRTRIFERFYRVDKARSRAVGGTGLGLSLVRHATERSKGTLKLESSLGEGSEFTVSLPRARMR